MKKSLIVLAAGAILLPTAPLHGQIAWDAPLMVGTSTPTGWGIYLSDPTPGSGIGVFSTWRSGGPFGFRIGLGEDARDKLAIFGGVDYSRPLVTVSDDFPIDISWVAGAGFGLGDVSVLSFPVGAAFGREFELDGIAFNPYVAPRVILDAYIGDNPPRDALDLEFAFELGFDVAFEPGWTVRFAGSFGDREALAIGVSFRVF